MEILTIILLIWITVLWVLWIIYRNKLMKELMTPKPRDKDIVDRYKNAVKDNQTK